MDAVAIHADRFRWWYLPSWLGLDAPCVVSTWTWAVSHAIGEKLPIQSVAAMFLVVWAIYLLDRLIDVADCRDWTEATGRLRFGQRHRPMFVACLCACLAGLLALLWNGLPFDVIERGVLVAMGVGLHFALFVVPVFRHKALGKELGVGLFFALGAFVCLGANARSLPLFGSIALVVAFNCLLIAARDADSDRANDPGGASCWWPTLNRDLLWIGGAFTLVVTLAAIMAGSALFFAVALAFAGLTILHQFAQRLSGDSVRALADFALLSPVVMLVMRA